MNVGVGAGQRVAAVLATAAWTRLRTDAEQALAQPEREPLLAGAERPLKKQRRGEGASLDRILEALAKRLVAMEWKERHEAKLRSLDPFRRVAHRMPSRHGS